MSKHKNQDSIMQVIGLFALVFFGFYFVFTSINTTKKDKDSVDLATLDRQVDMAINRSMRGVYSKKQLRDLEIKSNKTDIAEKFHNQSKNWAPSNIKSEVKDEIYDEDLSNSEVSMSSLSVESQLRSSLSERKENADQLRREKEEYKRIFKENAKKDGWLVELDDNLNVISAKEINKSF